MITTAKVLTKAERDSLVRVCGRALGTPKEGRNGLLFLLLLETGVRVQELLNLRIRDFNFENMSIFVYGLKGSNDRELPLKPGRARDLRRFILWAYKVEELRLCDPENPIFNITYDRLVQLWHFYRPNQTKTLHSLRHTFAVELYDRTKDLKAVQLCLGHRSITNTMVYVDFCYSQHALRKLMHG